MGKQLERFVKAVVGDILKQDYPYLTSPAILLARVSAVKTLSDTYEAEELDIHNDEGGTSYRGHIVGRWQEYTLTVVDRFGSEDSISKKFISTATNSCSSVGNSFNLILVPC